MNDRRSRENRALWRSRRGTLELDLLLVPFVEQRFALLDDASQAQYLALLDLEDWDIFEWIQATLEVPAEHVAVVEAIREFRRTLRIGR